MSYKRWVGPQPGRNNARGAVNQSGWFRLYKKRMRDGLEFCRECGAVSDLTFGHLIPYARGGKYSLDNLTILCDPCNKAQGDTVWPHLRSLKEEEAEAPPERRWAENCRRGPLQPERAALRAALIPPAQEVLTRIYPQAADLREVAGRLGQEPADVRAALKSLRRRGEAVCDSEGRWSAAPGSGLVT